MVLDNVMAVLESSPLGWCRAQVRSSFLLCENGQATKDEGKKKSHIEEEKQVEITSQMS